MQIDLGGGDAAVAHPVADLDDGDPVGGFVGAERVAQGVAAEALGDAGCMVARLQQPLTPYRFPRQSATFALLHGTKPHVRLIFIARGVKVERVDERVW